MDNKLTRIKAGAEKILADIARLQRDEFLSTLGMERLTRQSQRLAIHCRELWADNREDDFGPSVEAP